MVLGSVRVSRRATLAAAFAALPSVGLAACSSAGADRRIASGLRVLVPNAAGGGFDTTARIAARALEAVDGADRPEVFNLEGAGGAVGLARTVHERGNADLLMMMGLGVVGAAHTNHTEADLAQVTPVARLLSEPEVLLVSRSSRHRDLASLVRDWRARPGSLAVGGGSLPGGPDHLATHLLAEELGVDLDDVRYRQYDGGGPLLAALFSGQVDVAVSGVLENIDQIRAGAVRVLAVTGDRRVPGVDAPTLAQAGVDLRFTNWRGLVAPPGLGEGQQQRLVGLATRLHESTGWRGALRDYGWTDAFLTGTRFGAFLAQESSRVGAVLARLGIEPGQHQE